MKQNSEKNKVNNTKDVVIYPSSKHWGKKFFLHFTLGIYHTGNITIERVQVDCLM